MKLLRLFCLTLCLCAMLSVMTVAQNPPAPLTPAPSASLVKDGRVFEIRTYYAMPGKLEDLHARFRNHTNALFKKHGMEIVGYWGPLDKEKGSENTMVYLLAYPSREAREAAWKAFQADPDWLAARKKSEENGRLVEKVDFYLMKATNYSPMK
jgi:hypothetical protein